MIPQTRMDITDWDITSFTRGACYILALDIHSLTKWPIYSFWEIGSEDPIPDIHAFIKTPSGYFMDVKGFHTQSDLKADWRSFLWIPSDWTIGIVENHNHFYEDGWEGFLGFYEDGHEEWVRGRSKEIAQFLVREHDDRRIRALIR